MSRVPFGVSRLDATIDGGAPAGSTVLLVTEVGAGGRAFVHTAAVNNALAGVDEDLFELHYGGLHEQSTVPDGVKYLSFTDGREALIEEMQFALEDGLVDSAVEGIEFRDFSREYFQLSPVPSDWYTERPPDIDSLGDRHDRRDLLDAIGECLTERAEESLVVVDSVTDLISVAAGEMDWNDVTLLLKGLKKASRRWNGLVLLLVTRETLSGVQLGQLMDAADGTIVFEWEAGGNERARTMVVKEFRGVLSRLEEEEVVRFETEIHEGGFDISDVRKIR